MPTSPRTALRSFLEDPRQPAGTLAYHELQGFLFAIACAPELVTPSEWLPMVFDEQEPEYASLDEARTVIGELMELYNSVNAGVVEERAALPGDCRFRRDLLANLEETAPVAQWSRGFLRGHQWLEESWEPYVPEGIDEEYAAILMTLTFFASKDLAEAFSAEAGGTALAEMAKAIRSVFPDAVRDYAQLGRSIQNVLSSAATERPATSSRKVGRNEPCPCGSGRKYKRCCGITPH
jgi:uncharacterized protein